MTTQPKRVIGTPFQPGNPGRPKGSRNKLTEDFLKTMSEDFAQHGRKAVERVREEDPSTYLRVVSQIVPKEVKLDDDTLAALGRRDLLAFLSALREAEGADSGAGGGAVH